jgi:DNA-binding FadR family transcriptional regulator
LRSQIHAFLVYTWSLEDKVNKEFLPRWHPDHQELLEIIRAKQTTKAKAVIHEHVARGAKRVAKHFKESPSVNVPKKKR